MFKFCLVTFGCRVNQADSFACERDLVARGGVEAAAESADLVVVNTCSVTAAADQAARQAIRRIARRNPSARIVATGCYATRQAEDVGRLPGVIRLVSNDRKAALAQLSLAGPYPPDAASNENAGGATLDRAATSPNGAWDPDPASAGISPNTDRSFPRPGHRGRTAFPLRVQTGCDERCSYCTIPFTRGASRSRPLGEVLAEARMLARAGYKELILTGVHLGAFGRDLQPASSLLELLGALDRLPGDLSFRLSSLEPMDCSEAIVRLVGGSGRFARHFHLPLQHASDRVLAAMRRPYALADYRALVHFVRTTLPDAAIGSDIIVGFPGETEADHDVLERYLGESGLTHLHVFQYSDRPGAEAASRGSKVAAGVARRRAEALRAISRRLNGAFVETQVGLERPGLTIEDGATVVTDNYLKVRIPKGRARNERVRVRLTSALPLLGEVVA